MEVHTVCRFWRTNYEVILDIDGDNSFTCSTCSKCLVGKETILQGGKKYCWQCFEKLFSFKCASCFKPITGSSKLTFVLFNRHVWHSECFCCSSCRRPLEGQLVQKNDSFHCKRCGKNEIFLIG